MSNGGPSSTPVPVERELAAMFPEAPPTGGACSWHQPEFPDLATQCRAFDDDPDEAPSTRAPEIAKSICRRCPIRRCCAEYALRACEEYGIWGGTTGAERASRRGKAVEVAFREQRVAAMSRAGVSANDIAGALDVHPATVRRDLQRTAPPAA